MIWCQGGKVVFHALRELNPTYVYLISEICYCSTPLLAAFSGVEGRSWKSLTASS